jgi:2'-5' RNA ligase
MVKWVAPDLLHITVRFLGGVAEARLPQVEQAAEAAASQSQSFSVRLAGLGAFPHARAPRVIWAGLEAGPGLDALVTLAGRVEAELRARGFPPEERAFSPHITLARTRDNLPASEQRHLGEVFVEMQGRLSLGGDLPVRALTIMRSDLGRSGPTYTPLAHLPLGRKG